MKELYRTAEAREHLGICNTTLWAWINKGHLKITRVGRLVYITNMAEFTESLKAGKVAA